jgi:hypothetical protein
MPMMAPNSIPGEKLRQHYGLSVAKKRRTRRSHATGRYGGFVAIVGDVRHLSFEVLSLRET